MNKHITILLLCLLLSGCIGPCTDYLNPNASCPPNTCMDIGDGGPPQCQYKLSNNYLPTGASNLTPVQGSPFYIEAGNSDWVKVYNFPYGHVKYKIEIAPGPTRPNAQVPEGVPQNNVLNLCYEIPSSYSTVPELLGVTANNSTCNSYSSISPNSNVKYCAARLSDANVYNGAKLYVALENGSYSNESENISPYTNNIIQNHCPGNAGSVCTVAPPSCTGSSSSSSSGNSGSSENSNCPMNTNLPQMNCSCTSQVLSPLLYQVEEFNNCGPCGGGSYPYPCKPGCRGTRGYCSSYYPCSTAYEGQGQLSQDFIEGKCLFANGMGYAFGYGNNNYGSINNYNTGNLRDGNSQFDNSIDPGTMILQNSQVIDLPGCQGSQSQCAVNFSLVGSQPPNTYYNGSASMFLDVGSSLQKTKYIPWIRQDGYYSLGINATTAQGCFGNSNNTVTPIMVTSLFYEKSGCYAVGGVPFNPYDAQENNGRLEYLFTKDAQASSTQTATGFITGTEEPEPFLNKVDFSPAPQYLYVRIHDSNDRGDNYGYYQVNVYVDQQSIDSNNFLGNLANMVINPIKNQIMGIGMQIFNNVASSNTFHNVINAMLTLYIVLFGIRFLIGDTKVTQKDLVGRLVKIGIVLVFMNSQTAGTFFSTYLFQLFWNGTTDLISYVTDTPYNVVTTHIDGATYEEHQLVYSALFSFVGEAVETFFTAQFLGGLALLLLWVPIGWLVIVILIQSLIVYLNALVLAVISYLIALTGIGLFISLAPIFIILVLFDQTRIIFNQWLQVMLSFAFQPIIMFAVITVINKLILYVLAEILDDGLTLQEIVKIYIPLGSIQVNLFGIYWWQPQMSVVNYLTAIVMLKILCEMLKNASKFAGDIARNLFKSGVGDSAGQIDDVARGMMNSAKKPLGLDESSQQKFAQEEGDANRAKEADNKVAREGISSK